MIFSVSDGREGFVWVMLDPPATPNDQALHYGTNGPYWKNLTEGKPSA